MESWKGKSQGALEKWLFIIAGLLMGFDLEVSAVNTFRKWPGFSESRPWLGAVLFIIAVEAFALSTNALGKLSKRCYVFAFSDAGLTQ